MPKAQLHWAHDLTAVVVLATVVALVFWLVPPAAAGQPAAHLNPSMEVFDHATT